MFISQVVLNARHRETYRLLSDIYAQHRFVMSAFPDRASEPANCGAVRSALNVLFRIDTTAQGGIVALVQSDCAPNWQKTAELHAGVICESRSKEDGRRFQAGERYRFRLRANPTVCRVNRDADGVRHPRRECVFDEGEQVGWLARAAASGGFAIATEAVLAVPCGKREGYKPSPRAGARPDVITSYAVDLNGTLTITDPEGFANTLRSGIGRDRAWGCGLLSVIRTAL
jgi:CRISPR system Cascade subunit CasE